MKILVVGSGGREHAIVWKLSQSPKAETIYCAPGNAGIAEMAQCVDIKATDIEALVSFAKEHAIDLTVIGMDDPLMLGVVDAFEAAGLRVFGPRKNAAIIEGSKAFSKKLMQKYGIPTAAFWEFTDSEEAKSFLRDHNTYPIVLKADGLALGKGVLICHTEEEALAGVDEIMVDKKFGAAGDAMVIEEFMTGPEVSVLSFCDGKTVKPMVSAQDHKRALDNDEGLNTGGMGTFSPSQYYTPEIQAYAEEHIFKPTLAAMAAEGRPFTGILFFGLMLTENGPKVLEYNARFGDPETQVVLPLLESDLLTIMQATTNGTLADTEVRFSDKYACCVITASAGYPVSYKKGYEITMTPEAAAHTYVAGAKLENGKLLTSGGRVTGTTAVAGSLADAIREAYRLADGVQFENAYRRSDIGQRALQAGNH